MGNRFWIRALCVPLIVSVSSGFAAATPLDAPTVSLLKRVAAHMNVDGLFDNAKKKQPGSAVEAGSSSEHASDLAASSEGGLADRSKGSDSEPPSPPAPAKEEKGVWRGAEHALGGALWWTGRFVHFWAYGLAIVSKVADEVSFGLMTPVVWVAEGAAGAGKYMAAAGARLSSPECRPERVAKAGRFTMTVGPNSATEEF